MSDTGITSDRLAAIREAFDRSFSELRPPEPPPLEDLVAIRVGTERYALRLSEIAGLYGDRKITRLPGSVPALLGLAAFRGAIVPVYDLAALLGHPTAGRNRWLMLEAGEAVALAFAAVDGQMRVPGDAIIAAVLDDLPRRFARQFIRASDEACPIVHVPSVLDAIRRERP